jgi:hypothetical protein
MYACIPDIGGGFFEGVCARENQPLTFRDPPLDSRIDSGRYSLAALSLHIMPRRRPESRRPRPTNLPSNLYSDIQLLHVAAGDFRRRHGQNVTRYAILFNLVKRVIRTEDGRETVIDVAGVDCNAPPPGQRHLDPRHPSIRELTLEDPPSYPALWVYEESWRRIYGNISSASWGDRRSTK